MRTGIATYLKLNKPIPDGEMICLTEVAIAFYNLRVDRKGRIGGRKLRRLMGK